jgi:hypothetical protein
VGGLSKGENSARRIKQGKGWQDIKFFNPVSRKIEPKRVYFEKHDNLVFACGACLPD